LEIKQILKLENSYQKVSKYLKENIEDNKI